MRLQILEGTPESHVAVLPHDLFGCTASVAAWTAMNRVSFVKSRDGTRSQERFYQCNLLRDIFGNPFQPITLDPVCVTSTVQQLANSIYQDRAFDRMPILGDALEEAGCDNAAILEHCPSGNEHVRGCWVLDLVLGKE